MNPAVPKPKVAVHKVLGEEVVNVHIFTVRKRMVADQLSRLNQAICRIGWDLRYCRQ